MVNKLVHLDVNCETAEEPFVVPKNSVIRTHTYSYIHLMQNIKI